MKTPLILKVPLDLNYLLIAIRSKLDDYQFAYFLNKSPFFFFKRRESDVPSIINKKKIYFSTFEDLNNELKRTSFLISNNSIYEDEVNNSMNLFNNKSIFNTAFLIPELKEFDYFIKLVGVWKKQELIELKKHLQQMKCIESETDIDLKTLRSIDNLVF
tara:strand:- start:906 stop:1382 length:477 start_codon:yes stop_codon:yes gene_type:complete